MGPIVIIKAIVALPIILFVPGYVTFHAFKVDKIENLRLSYLETIFIQIVTSIVTTGWIAFVLAELGYFSLFRVLIIVLVCSIIITLTFKVKFNLSAFPKPKLNLESLTLILIVIVSIGLFFFPSEYVVRGNMDANAYLCAGVELAETGSLIVHEPFSGYPEPIAENIKLYNQYTSTDSESGELHPSFLHLYPTWVALSYSIFGLRNCLYITPFFGLLGILSIFLLSKRLFNNKVALIAASLLCLNFAQICWSRTPFPEMLGQFLFLGGAYAFIVFRRSDHPFFSILSAVCIGELLLTRLEFIFIVIPIIFYLGFTKYKPKSKLYLTFLVPFCFLFLHSVIHNCTISRPYVFNIVKKEAYEVFKIVPRLFSILFSQNFVRDIDWYLDFIAQPTTSFLRVYIFIGVIVIFSVFILTIDTVGIIKKALANKRFTSTLRHLCVLLLLAFIAWNYFIRPQYFQPPPGIHLFHYRTHLVGFDAISLIRLNYFLIPPLGIWLIILGLLLLFYKKNNPGAWFFFLPGLFFLVFFIIRAPIPPPLPIWSRKFIPVIIPFLIVLIAYAVYILATRARLPWRLITIPLLVLFLVISSIMIISPLIGYTEYKGAINNMQDFADNFTKDDFVIFSYDEAGVLFARPLRFLFNKKAAMLRNLNPTEFEEMLRELGDGQKEIFFVSHDEEEFIDELNDLDHVEVILEDRITISYPQLEYTYLDLDTQNTNVVYNLGIYKARYVP